MGLCGIIIGAAWIAYGILGDGNKIFLTIVLILTILLGSGVVFFLRSRPTS
jgi:hypothetical protein